MMKINQLVINEISLKKVLFITLFMFVAAYISWAEKPVSQDSVTVYKIWDKAKHNGFPDLFLFKTHFYCTFREATGHVNNDNAGKVRVIRSRDGKNWENVALFEMEGVDVREARLSVTPEGNILAIIAAGLWKDSYQWLSPFVSFSDKSGMNFSAMGKPVIDPSIKPSLDWIWRVTWNKGIGYGIMYQVDYERNSPWKAQLLRTRDGRNYEKIKQLEIEGRPSESTIRFDKNNKMYILVRNDGEDQMGVLCVSEYPYENWIYNKMDIRLGGPNFLFLNDRQLIMGTRFWENKKAYTALLVTDLKGNVLKTIKLPSGGDTSYPGMVMYKNKLWVAYYSSHEGKTNIYMAVIPLKNLSLL
jgi:hypothetical protein